MKVVRAGQSDLVRLSELERMVETAYSSAVLAALLKNERVKVFKAVDNHVTVGYISVEIVFDEASVNNVVVDNCFRRRGAATLLINKAVQECRREGVKKIFLEVNQYNEGAIALYEKTGFERIAFRPKYYGDAGAAVYCLELK